MVDSNGNAAGGYTYTGEALLLDINPNFGLVNWTKVSGIDNSITQSNFASFIDFSNFSIKNNINVTATQYDALGEALMESIGNHYVAGDGRANENFALTSLHHVFHANHNVQLVNLETEILAQADQAHRNGFQVSVNGYHDIDGNYTLTNGLSGVHATIDQISWDQDKMFEAAKLINEMEYQHVAIDQYARLVTPDLPEFVTYDTNINSDISLEYSQAAFRFGHSQLRETIDAIDPQGMVTKWALSSAFLNPAAFAATGPEDIVRGMSRQLTNEVDEFVTPAMQQTLLGQPLDLAAINIARGRDVGLPTLNEARKQLHDALIAERQADPSTPHHTNLIVDNLNPYASWKEFGSQMQHPESLVNFIAAYAFDGDLAKAEAIVGLEANKIKNGAAEALGYTKAQAIRFLNHSVSNADETAHSGLKAAADGFNKIDLWIGGLAEIHVFTGQLGTTFNAIFEDQMERLMDGDRFYYFYRLGGQGGGAIPIDTDLGHMIATEQFKDIIERTTGALHLNGDVLGYADSYIDTFALLSTAGQSKLGGANDVGIYSTSGSSGNNKTITLGNADLKTLGLGMNHKYVMEVRPDKGHNPDGTPASGYNSHEVIWGTDHNDWIDAGNGDDTIYGDGGNDVLDGKAGADHIYGGDGNDVIYGGDIEDFLDGGAGDDIIYAGTSAGALDVVIGGDGDDRLYGEAGIDEMYGGAGNDYIDAGGDTDLAFGDSGNDVMYGGDGPDELRGGTGDDIISGGSGGDKLLGEAGDDIILGGIGQSSGGVAGDSDELIGDVGFDMASFSDFNIDLSVAADLRNQGVVVAIGGTDLLNPQNQLWTDLEGIIGSKFADTLLGNDTADENWLIGGGRNDVLQGFQGNDLLVGDTIILKDLVGSGGLLASSQLAAALPNGVTFGQHFTDLLASQPNMVLGGDGGPAGANDNAVFVNDIGHYTIAHFSFGAPSGATIDGFTIQDDGASANDDGTDIVIGVEKFTFNGHDYFTTDLLA